MPKHLDKVQDIAGFATSDAEKGEVELLTRASITSDHPDFYTYINQISKVFLVRALINNIYQCIIIIHQDLSADLYLNEPPMQVEIKSKRDLQKGEVVYHHDIADIRRLQFPNTQLDKTDRVIYCFKVGWKFGLFFDLHRDGEIDIEQMSLDLGTLYRFLQFEDVYKSLESQSQFTAMIKEGWFPFIEIIGREYETLSLAYQNRAGFEARISGVIDAFNQARIDKITEKWWRNQIFLSKRPIITAGIQAYLSNDASGFINCIKNLSSEVEGIIRLQYFQDTGEGKPSFLDILGHVVEKGKIKTASDSSLFFPLHFFQYLKTVVFAGFDLEKGEVDLSRHTSSHGVANAIDYTRIKALQMILVLDQIFFYIQ